MSKGKRCFLALAFFAGGCVAPGARQAVVTAADGESLTSQDTEIDVPVQPDVPVAESADDLAAQDESDDDADAAIPKVADDAADNGPPPPACGPSVVPPLALLALPATLPADTTTVLAGFDRTVLVRSGLEPSTAILGQADASCPTGEEPWLVEFVTPTPGCLALQANGDVLVGVAGGDVSTAGDSAAGLPFGFVVHGDGTAATPVRVAVPSPKVLKCGSQTCFYELDCAASVAVTFAALPSTTGSFRAVRLLATDYT